MFAKGSVWLFFFCMTGKYVALPPSVYWKYPLAITFTKLTFRIQYIQLPEFKGTGLLSQQFYWFLRLVIFFVCLFQGYCPSIEFHSLAVRVP